MADPQLDALIYQIDGIGTLLKNVPGTTPVQQGVIAQEVNKTTTDLKNAAASAKTEKEREEIRSKVEAAFNAVPAIASSAIELTNAVKSGDPYAISASTLDLANSVVSMVGALTGPIGAAAAAIFGAILSIVSMILKLFVKQSPSLLEQIEELMRKIKSEDMKQSLEAAKDAIESFTNQANAVKELKDTTIKYSFQNVITMLNPTEGNTLSCVRLAQQWLLEKKNLELPYWGEVLALQCEVYINFKLSLSQWLPHMQDTAGEDGTAKLIIAFNSNDSIMLRRLEAIKPVARLRGIVWHSGLHSLYAQDVVNSTKDPKALGGPSGDIFTVSKRNGETSAHPYLTIFRVRSDSPGQFDPRHRFARKGGVEDLDGQWPLHDHSKWGLLKGVKDCYDVWATTGRTKGEINLYTADADGFKAYVHNLSASGEHLQIAWGRANPPGYKVGAIRVVHWPKPSAEQDQVVLQRVERAHYALCEVTLTGKQPFAIQVFFHGEDGEVKEVKGDILLPKIFQDPGSLNLPVGIAVDSVRLWVFGTWFIACATHADVKRCVEKGESLVPWLTYEMPADVAGYDPKAKAPRGLRDLSACDDGTLTAVFQDDGGTPRIITATTCFQTGKPIIQTGDKTDFLGNVTSTSGWVMDKSVHAYRVHKQPIFCWSVVETLEAMLKVKEAKAMKEGKLEAWCAT